MSLDQNKTYLVWNGTTFPNSTYASFKAPAGSTIDWGDGTVETFTTASTNKNTHTYTDGKTEHTIVISGLKSISTYSFYGCNNLTSVNIGNVVTLIGSGAFAYCSNLTSVVIPDSVTTLSGGVFNNCTSLKSVIMSNNLTSIPDYTFQYCTSLTSITIPDSVKSIGYAAFLHCNSLTSVTIGNSVTSIGDLAFYECSSLKQLILFPSYPPTVDSYTIPATISKIYVQQSSKAAYQAATNWNAFATEQNNKIVSDNLYLSFVRFNQKNKEYISEQIRALLN